MYSLVLVTALVGALISYVIHRLIQFTRFKRTVNRVPGNPTHWLWGSLHEFPGLNDEGLAFAVQVVVKYPRSHRAWFGPFKAQTYATHPDTAKEILRTTEPKPTSFGAYGLGRDWIGDGLLLSAGKKWARNRRLLTPAFHFDILKPYIRVKNDATEPLLEKMHQCAVQHTSMEVFSPVSLFTFDVILRCSMSYDDNIQEKGEHHPYVQAVSELGHLWTDRFMKPWLHSDLVYYMTSNGRAFKKNCNFVHAMSENIIQSRMAALQMTSQQQQQGGKEKIGGKYKDFLDVLLTAKDDDGQGLTLREIRDEVDTFLFEGHDTTASAISWTLYSLAINQQCQLQCQQEIDSILNERESDEILWEDLGQLKYVTMCVREAMRLHGPVPIIQRELTKPFNLDGVLLPPGCTVEVPIYSVHHNPQVWGEDHMSFKPDRFLPENFDKMDSFAYIPFSAGPRNCIGQHFAMHEMKIIIARILRRFNLTLDSAHPVHKKWTLTMRTQTGIKLLVTPRQQL